MTYLPDSGLLKSFNGQLVTSIGKATTHVRVGQADALVSLTVMKDDCLTYDCIVGCDVLNKPDILIIKTGTKVIVHQLSNVKLASDYINCPLSCNVTNEGFKLQFGDIKEKAKRQCQDLMNEFRQCISL